MQLLCVLLVASGAGILLCSIVKYYKFLAEIKKHMNERRLFVDWVYAACFAMMLFFLVGYVINLGIYSLSESISTQDVLVAFIFFFGAIFVLAMVAMVRRMYEAATDRAGLKKQLRQQELMSAISQSFTTTEDPQKLIREALKMSGEFMCVDHAFLSRYQKEQAALECLNEWCDKKARPFIGGEVRWPITPDMQIYNDFISNKHVAVNDYLLLTHPNFETVKGYDMRAFLNIPIEVSGKFWGIVGFIIYEEPYDWNDSDIHLGNMIAGVFSGVIRRNIAEEELIKAKELAEQGSRAKSDFLSRMSHEMRTPMNAIIGMADIGKSSPDIDRKDYCFGRIKSASAQLLSVISDILDMSKIEANKLELTYTSFNLKKMIASIVDVVGSQMEAKDQRFILSVDYDVPEAITSDEQKLGQVLTNLLDNAAKFTPDNGTISLLVHRLFEENSVCTLQFEVKDTGIGIPKEMLTKLFIPFEQIDGSISRKYGGTGLGLAISKQLVEMLDGKIKVESAVGYGSSFIFEIRAGTELP